MAPSWCIRLQPFATIILYVFLSVHSTYYVSSLETDHSVHEINELKKMKMVREYLQKINKPAKKTIKSPDGDLIDCVLFHKQPGFDNPLFKEKISMVPPKMSKSLNSTYTIQRWNANGEKCPKGTIPIRRTTEEDVLRAGKIERFGMKHNSFSNQNGTHEYAIAHSELGSWTKSKASLGIWKPFVVAEEDAEFSLCQLWVSAGRSIDQVNSVEAGWHVYPQKYGNSDTRFFVYWTNNSYQRGYGCYNTDCPGFVQTSNILAPGAAFRDSNISVYNGVRRDLTLSIEWRVDRNWWLYWHSNQGIIQLGYWPGIMFPHLNGPAERLDFGGEVTVYPNKYTGLHSMTKMGSGHFPEAGLKRAAYVSNIEMNGQRRAYRTYTTNRFCYGIDFTGIAELGTSFFYGGPGYGGRCR